VGVLGGTFSSSGYGVYRAGRLGTNSYIQMNEMAAPAAPAANQARILLRDSGGKTQVCVRFATGAVQVIEAEP